MVPLGSSVAACTLTGNFLGEGKPKMAKQFSETTLYFNQTVLVSYFCYRNQLRCKNKILFVIIKFL